MAAPWSTLLMDGVATGTLLKIEEIHDEDVRGYIVSYNLTYDFLDRYEHRYTGHSQVPRDTSLQPLEVGKSVDIRYFGFSPQLNGIRAEGSMIWRLPFGLAIFAAGWWFTTIGIHLWRKSRWPKYLGGNPVRFPDPETD